MDDRKAEVSPSSTAVSSRQEHSPMTINPDDLALAREWAERVREREIENPDAPIYAAARIIQALPDEWVPAVKVRNLVAGMRNDASSTEVLGNVWTHGWVTATEHWSLFMENVLPAPPRKPAMIKRGATAWHDELGEVTILSNKPNRGAGLAAVTDLVRVAADWDEGDDGSQVATVNASSLTAPDEGLVDSGAPETNNDSADDEEVDDSPEHVKDLLDYAQGVRGALEWYDDADMLAETIRDSYHVASDTPLEDANLIIAIPELAQGYIDQAEQIERLDSYIDSLLDYVSPSVAEHYARRILHPGDLGEEATDE